MKAAAVIVAAGRGRRFGGDTPKQLLDLGGIPILAWSVDAFARHDRVEEVVAVLPEELAQDPPGWLASRGVRIVAGGQSRAESVARGVAAVSAEASFVLVHDGVRPFVSADLIGRVVEAARAGPVVPVVPVVDTIKEVDEGGRVVRTLERSRLAGAQTPQGFPARLLRAACETASGGPDGEPITDDAHMVERRGAEVRTVPGERDNLKITSGQDYLYARWLVAEGRVRRP